MEYPQHGTSFDDALSQVMNVIILSIYAYMLRPLWRDCYFAQTLSSPVFSRSPCLQVGVGKFQWLMLGICGLANAADATEILSIGLVATGAERALNLTPQRQVRQLPNSSATQLTRT